MSRVLQPPRFPDDNVRVYHNNGTLLASMRVTPSERLVTHEMLYRYCNMLFIVAGSQQWSLFVLRSDDTIGRRLLRDSQSTVRPGNYLVLYANQGAVSVQLTTAEAPRRVVTHDESSRSHGQREREVLQAQFRTSLRARDGVCAITNTGPRVAIRGQPFSGLEASHVFPTSQISTWNRCNLRRHMTDPRPTSQIGESGLYSMQNGLLLAVDIHAAFDAFSVGIDVDADYKIIVFGDDPGGIGGSHLKHSARYGTDGTDAVSPDMLRWHLRMCVYKNMKANAQPETLWEEDLSDDDMGEIMQQPDAGQRMEIELFTRLGPMIA